LHAAKASDTMRGMIALVPDKDENGEWAALTTDQFLKGYAESDAIYDTDQPGDIVSTTND
jgi:hypothetical protein